MKSLLRAALTSAPLQRVWHWGTGPTLAVFFGHRFRCDGAPDGHDPAMIEVTVAELRRRGFVLADLQDVLESCAAGEPLVRPTICFTFDDGYADQAEIGASVFASLDCPVTFFVATGFLDGEVWMWWDQVAHALEATAVRRIELVLRGERHAWAWTDDAGRTPACHEIAEALKLVEDAERRAAVQAIAEQAGVAIPAEPPARFRAMSWDDARRIARQGARIAAHSVTHPILAQCAPKVAQQEIRRSMQRVQAELGRGCSVFCPPNGRMIDYRVSDLEALGSEAPRFAVCTDGRYVAARDARALTAERYRIPRFSLPATLPEVLQVATGLEAILQRLPLR